MKRIVVITIEVDPTEYHEAKDDIVGTMELVVDMLRGEADFPEQFRISCDGIEMDPPQWEDG